MYREEKYIDGPSGPGANRSTNNNNNTAASLTDLLEYELLGGARGL
jgi:hypothetical protein